MVSMDGQNLVFGVVWLHTAHVKCARKSPSKPFYCKRCSNHESTPKESTPEESTSEESTPKESIAEESAAEESTPKELTTEESN